MNMRLYTAIIEATPFFETPTILMIPVCMDFVSTPIISKLYMRRIDIPMNTSSMILKTKSTKRINVLIVSISFKIIKVDLTG